MDLVDLIPNPSTYVRPRARARTRSAGVTMRSTRSTSRRKLLLTSMLNVVDLVGHEVHHLVSRTEKLL